MGRYIDDDRTVRVPVSRDDSRGKPVALMAGAPLHRQLFLVLHDEIARGAIPAGNPLPTEQELCDQFGVSRITVRRALADLADQGYITRRQGVGSFVREHDAPARQVEGRSYMDELRQIHFESNPDVLEFDLRAAPQTIADKVGLAGDVLHIVRVRRERRTGEPLLVTEAWLPASLAEMITPEKLVHAPLYGLFAEAGVTVERVQHEFIAEIANPRTAQLLDIAVGAAVQRVNRLAFTAADRPHHYLSILLSPSRSRILLNHSAAEMEVGDIMAITHDVRPD
ncbi:MAG: GntR family transcriptional regulator [Mycobacterium sp.]|jgi:GntR family transcriptional regulator|nr:GntR family transcriptional regulator [Mycobacterium sp.]